MHPSDAALSAAAFGLAAVLAATPALTQEAPRPPAGQQEAAAVSALNAMEAERLRSRQRLDQDYRARRDAAFRTYAAALEQGEDPMLARQDYLGDLAEAEATYQEQIERLAAEYAQRRAALRAVDD